LNPSSEEAIAEIQVCMTYEGDVHILYVSGR
jgi:hypothetical protein